MIDLQMHSNFSDGSDSPTELVRQARALGLRAIALTDHDTIDGLPEFLSAGRELGVTTVPGVEISIDTKLPNNGHMHLLGLFIDPEAGDLKRTLDYLREQRNLRAEKIIRKLNELNVPITMEELLAEAGEGSIGRPHVAKILLRKGVVSSIQEAFDVYLAKGKPAYMDKVKLGEADAIRMVKDAGGLAILAHPHLMNYDTWEETRDKILALRELGLDGFEAYYSTMPAEFSQKLLALAREFDFAVSGGSDYHGANKDNIRMGVGLGDLHVPDAVYDQLKARWEAQRSAVAAAK
ncbi:MAG: PHP domain-containing protein [Calditrichaeota bacterium]|nr:MAG: PHP domain-containing protein [Calditrichota bacterium]